MIMSRSFIIKSNNKKINKIKKFKQNIKLLNKN